MDIKRGNNFQEFFGKYWGTKELHHQGNLIIYSIICEKLTARYHIAKSNLTIVFPYSRWKWTKNSWGPLDSDAFAKEEVELQIFLQTNDEHLLT